MKIFKSISGLPAVASLLRSEGWFRETPPHLLATFRICFGAFLLLYWGLMLPHVRLMFSHEGLLLPLFGLAPPSFAVACLLYALFLFTLMSFTAGFCTRMSAAISFLLNSYYWILTLHQLGGSFDRLFITILFVLLWSGCGETFSVDARLRHGSWTAWRPISILPQRILAVQITLTYVGVGLQKVFLPGWQSGEILVYGFIGRWGTGPAYALARMNIPLRFYDVLVFLVKAFEITIPFGLWSRRYRLWFMAGGALFHTGIAILLGIWWFLALIPAYLLFFSPEEYFAFLQRRCKDTAHAAPREHRHTTPRA